jgi:phosphonate transport system substrate-binding protein
MVCLSAIKRLLIGTATLLSLPFLLPLPSAQAADSYVFGVVPQFERRQLYAIWQPVLDEIAKRSGVSLHIATTLSVHDFEQEMSKGKFDFIYTNPYHVLKERKDQGYIPLVRGEAPLKGILMVPKDGPIKSIKDLAGKTLAVPTPNALGASIMIQADLEKLYGIRVKLQDVKTHASVFLHVANGLVDAGGSVQKMLSEQKAEIRDRISVLYSTRDMPSHPVAAHPRVPEQVRNRVQKAFLDLAADKEGAGLLARIPMSPLVAATMGDYVVMEDWGLDKFWDIEGSL